MTRCNYYVTIRQLERKNYETVREKERERGRERDRDRDRGMEETAK